MGILSPTFAVLVCFSLVSSTYGAVTLTINGLAVQIKNERVELNFNADATISTLLVEGQNIAPTGVKSFYLDWTTSVLGLFTPDSIHVVEQTSERVHFFWRQEKFPNIFNIDLHYIMFDELPGIYTYAKYTNNQSDNVTVGETRIVYRFEGSILTQGTNEERTGTIPTFADFEQATVVQDSTWQFANGTYYTKYDYATYVRKIQQQGIYGNGFGAFIISPSREYNAGGPLKQELTVHQEALILNVFVSGHLSGNPPLSAPPQWTHIYGPFLLYFPTGDNDQIRALVSNQVTLEANSWPYSFVKDAEYPLSRGTVSGIVSGQKKATVVLWDSMNEEFDRQELGYLYSADTDDKGYYIINKVRPGTYKIAAYPVAGNGSENLVESQVTVTAGTVQHVGFTLPEPENIMWSIGEANRLANEFNYADEPRNYEWQLKPPVTNTFTIGQSDPKVDWYYAQSHPGHWYIKYQDRRDGRSRTLRIALAAASQKTHLTIYVNGHRVGSDYFENDHAIYRSAMKSGHYTSIVHTVEEMQVVHGENTIDLWLSLGQIMYDAISLQWN